jgi:hypothetical protein
MKCRICGLECPPAAKICRDCASARKRAFAATVTQPLLAAVGAPSVGEPRFLPRPTRRRRPRAANDPAVRCAVSAPPAEAALPLTVVPRKLGLLWFAVAAVIIVAVLIAIMRTASEGSHVTDEVVPKPPSSPLPPATVEPSPAAAIPSVHEAPSTESVPAKSVAPKAPRKPSPRPEPAPTVAAEPAPLPEPPVVARPVAPARTMEPARADPWQALNEGLARCAREGILERIGCEQRLRSQYCGNSWGLAPQCPIGPGTDHGQ